jgi:hypothetical protein
VQHRQNAQPDCCFDGGASGEAGENFGASGEVGPAKLFWIGIPAGRAVAVYC